MPGWPELIVRGAEILTMARARGLRIATAESCTGGMIAAALTEVPGSSDVFERGFVVYSNASKSECLGVAVDLIASEGAVSKAVAAEMARGALAHSAADLAVSVTGVAGPGGGTAGKPVGLVHLAAAMRDGRTLQLELQAGDVGRDRVRLISVSAAFDLLQETLAI